MRAIVWTEYGPPEGLRLETVPVPVPRRGELLIRVRATTVAAGDSELRGLRFSAGLRVLIRLMMGISRPRRKILGQEFAGDVAAVGPGSTRFQPGDRVFGTTGLGFGAYAEYLRLPERSTGRALTTMPANMTYEEAATVPVGGLEAVHYLRAAGDLRDRKVLVNGAAGGIGAIAVQLAKGSGAEVTGVDAAAKHDLVRSLGAGRVIDYARDDFTRDGTTYDVIFDVVGTARVADCLASLRDGGCLLVANPRLSTMLRGTWGRRRTGKKVVVRPSAQREEDLEFLRREVEAGRVRAVIDRRFPLDQVPDAHRYFETGAARGRIVILP